MGTDLLTQVESESKKQPVYALTVPITVIPNKPYGHFKSNPDKCFYCENTLTHASRSRDHIIPKVLGGKLTDKNKVWACTKCNNNKNNLTLNVWKRHLMRMRKPKAKKIADSHVYQHRLTIIKNIDFLLRKL